MKLTINRDLCYNVEACVESAPEVFGIDYQVSIVRIRKFGEDAVCQHCDGPRFESPSATVEIPKEHEAKAMEAAFECPSQAIVISS